MRYTEGVTTTEQRTDMAYEDPAEWEEREIRRAQKFADRCRAHGVTPDEVWHDPTPPRQVKPLDFDLIEFNSQGGVTRIGEPYGPDTKPPF